MADPSATWRKLRRRLLVLIAGTALFLILLALSAAVALRSHGARQALLGYATDALREATGIEAHARDFRLAPLTGRLEIFDLSLAAGGAGERPFLKVPEVRATFRWRSLVSGPAVLTSVDVDGPRLDLSAPLPALSDDDGEDGPIPLTIGRLVVERGTVVAEPAPIEGDDDAASLEVLLDRLELDGLWLEAALRDGALTIATASSGFTVSSSRRPPIAGRAEITGARASGGTLAIDSLSLEAPGLRAHGAGSLRIAEEATDHEPSRLDLELEADLGRLFPDLTERGELSARLALEPGAGGALSARGDLRAAGLPAALLEPWLEPAAASIGFDWRGTLLEAEGRLDVGAATSFDGTLDWHRGDETLLHAALQGGPRDREWIATARAEALPARPGQRHLRGELHAPLREDGQGFDWDRAELREGRIEIAAEDLADVAARLGVEAETIEAWGLSGDLASTVLVSGPLANPELRGGFRWRREGSLVLSIEGNTPSGLVPAADAAPSVVLAADLLPARAGTRRLRGTLDIADWSAPASWLLRGGRLELAEGDLAGLRREIGGLVPALAPRLPVQLLQGTLAASVETAGPLAALRVAGEAEWRPSASESARFDGSLELAPWSTRVVTSGTARAEIRDLELARIPWTDDEGRSPNGRASAEADLAWTADSLSARVRGSGRGLGLGEDVLVSSFSFNGSLEDRHVELVRGAVELGPAAGGDLSGGRIDATAKIDFDPDGRVSGGHASLGFTPLPGGRLETADLARLVADVRLAEGTLVVDPLAVELGSGAKRASATASIPLGTLAAIGEPLAALLADLPLAQRAGGPLELRTEGIDLAPLVRLARAIGGPGPEGPESGAPELTGRLVAEVALDPTELASAVGELRVENPALATPSRRMEGLDDLRIGLDDGRWSLEPLAWRMVELPLSGDELGRITTSGWMRIARPAPLAALFDDPLAALADLELDIHGSTDAELLNPFLAGGVASGPIELDLDLTGPARAPRGRLRLAGPQVRVYFPRPYPTRIESVEIELSASEGELVVERAEAGLNRGTIRLGGGLDRTRGLALTCRLDGVRYRLDYGLTVQIAGELALERPPGGTGRLSGELVVDRGMLRRDLDLDRELIAALFGPPDLTGTEANPLDALQLDLQLTTREGVSVANNLADLHVDWNLLRLRGTVANPVLQGRLDADPGGLVTAFGQTVRVDRGALTLSGDPTVEPRLDLEVTTSFDDPTLGRKERWATPAGWGDRGEWATGTFGAGSGWEGWYESLASGLGQHYTERFLTRLSGGLVSTSVGFEPLPIFGETDGQARLTIEQRLSPYLSYLLSINVREGEARTDLVEISGLRSLPGLTAQMFSNDAGNPGATLAQTLHLGGREPDSDDPRLRRLLFADPEALPPGRLLRYRLRRAAGFRRGDTIPAGAEFDVEMDVAEQLRREGYPGALVEVTRKKVSESRVDLRLDVEAGPRVEIAFGGAELPRAIRRRIAGLYQPERLAEAASLAEMREETARALHAQGYLEAEVGVRVEPPDPERPGVRTLRVECRVGERIDPDEPVFRGVDAEIADALEVSFSSRLARIELALGTPGAEAEVRRVLRRFGYPEATVAGRRLEAEGRRLTVSVEPGPLARIGAVELAGVPPDEVERLRGLVPLEAGSPLRGDQVTRAVALLEEDFRGRGHADARVEVGIEPDPQDPWRATVRLEVRPGPSYRLSGVAFEGLRSTDPDWAADVAALEQGAQVSDEQLAEARRRLYGTRVFRGIRSRREPLGEPAAGARTVDTRAVFEVEEIARYAVSFGGRWESEEGLGGVVYAADRNFLGKGRTLGVQAIHAGEERRSLGLFHAWPRFLRPNLLLELFVEGSQELENDQELSRADSWVQLTFPLGARTRSRVYLDREDRRFGPLPGNRATTGAEAEPGRLVDTFLGWQLIHDTRQRTLGASDERLLFLGLDVSGSHEALGSDTTSIRLFGQIKAYVPFGRERSASPRPLWAQSLRAGWIETTGGELAPVDRLRAGGEYSVRGYPTESLGPLDEEGRPLGGEIFLVLNEELQVPLWREVLGVVFFDAGNVWASRRDLDWELATSAGVGLRSPSPIGPLRLDLAFPLDRREGIDPEYKVYFGFGPTF